MRRALVIGLILLVSVAVFVGVRPWHPRKPAQLAVELAAATANKAKPSAPISPDAAATEDAAKPSGSIPQNPAAIKKHRQALLAWNQRTLREAYEQVGKKDPRWDELARKTFDLAVRMFSRELDPQVTFNDVFTAAKAAVDAGCDDPMLAYLHARTSAWANESSPREARRLARAAAQGLESSRYPAIRRAVALSFSGAMALSGRIPGDANRKQAEHDFDAALALLAESVANDERNAFWEAIWLNTLMELTKGYRSLGISPEAAYERVDAGLARVDGANVLRLIYRGSFWFGYGWEARTVAFAPAVPEGGFDSLEKRLAMAREALQDAWKLQPGSGEVARKLVEIDKSVGGDRATMELWFERAMRANGDDRDACWSKLDWLDPKWHGSAEEMLAFGRDCRDTKNSWTGITLLVADAHWRIACMAGENRTKYLASPEVWGDIESVYHEYLKHHPMDNVARSKFATFCHLSTRYREAEEHYVALGDRLTPWSEFPYLPMDQMKRFREQNADVVSGKFGRVAFPGWHFVSGKNEDGEWIVNIPVGAPRQQKPGILGADVTQVWNCTADGVTYGIRVLSLPPALRNDSPEHTLNAARAVVAKERGARPRDLRDTQLAARSAQEYDVDAPALKPMQLRVKTAVIGNWLYELSVVGNKSNLTSDAVQEFFDSFTFRPKAKPTSDKNKL